jgi:choline kinase
MTRPARVFILAAGTGTRLMPLTADRPKCMVPLAGRTLLDRQLEVMSGAGLTDIVLVAGHGATQVREPRVRVVLNPDYASTNMVASLFCAESAMTADADMVVSYGDIVYQRSVLDALLAAEAPVAVCVDRGWRTYWEARMADPLGDAETLKHAADGRIIELGKRASRYEDIQGQYIGLFKVRADWVPRMRDFYRSLDRGAQYDGKPFERMFMTSFLQAMIDAGFELRPVPIQHGWLEVDTLDDLALVERLRSAGRLNELYDEQR